jgi:hypothetical protein
MPYGVPPGKAVITRICGEFEFGNEWNLERGEEGGML